MPEHHGRTAGAGERAVARGIWSGSITFGLVSVPVELYSAQRRSRPPLRMLGPEGTPLVRQYVCPKDNRVLRGEDLVRGYEIEKGKFVIVTDEELEKLAPRSSRDIELTRFVDRDDIDPSYFERSYYLLPGGGQTKAYRLLADTLERTHRAGVAHFVMRGKGYAVAIFAEDGLLRAETLRFGDEVRRPEDIGLPGVDKPAAARLKRVRSAVEKLIRDEVDEAELQDDQVERILDIARRKQERGEDVIEAEPGAEEPEGETQVIDLMRELQRRLSEKATTRNRTNQAPAPTRSRTARRKSRRAASKSAHGSG